VVIGRYSGHYQPYMRLRLIPDAYADSQQTVDTYSFKPIHPHADNNALAAIVGALRWRLELHNRSECVVIAWFGVVWVWAG